MTTERIDVLAAIDELIENEAQECPAAITLRRREARAAMAELIEADREHDAAREHLAGVNRHIAEKGWLDIEFDALRKACARFVEAQFRRSAALARVGGAA